MSQLYDDRPVDQVGVVRQSALVVHHEQVGPRRMDEVEPDVGQHLIGLIVVLDEGGKEQAGAEVVGDP